MAVDFFRPGQVNHYRVFAASPAFTPTLGVAPMVAQLRSKHAGGVNAILIGLMPVPSYKIAPQSSGIIAVLIGLLLPAVQKLSQPGASDLQALKRLLKPGGSIGIAMGDGSVRIIVGPPMNLAAIH